MVIQRLHYRWLSRFSGQQGPLSKVLIQIVGSLSTVHVTWKSKMSEYISATAIYKCLYSIRSFIVLSNKYYITPPPEDLWVCEYGQGTLNYSRVAAETDVLTPSVLSVIRSSSWDLQSAVTGRQSQCRLMCWRSLRRRRLGVCQEQTEVQEV